MLVTQSNQMKRKALLTEIRVLRTKQRIDWTHVESGTSEVLDWLYSIKENTPEAAKTLAYIENLIDTMAMDREVINKMIEYMDIQNTLIFKETQFAIAEADLGIKMLDKRKTLAKFLNERAKLIDKFTSE